MADEVDKTADRIELEEALIVGDICRKAQSIPTGYPGECYFCGEEKARVVFVAIVEQDVCGACRDKRKLP